MGGGGGGGGCFRHHLVTALIKGSFTILGYVEDQLMLTSFHLDVIVK